MIAYDSAPTCARCGAPTPRDELVAGSTWDRRPVCKNCAVALDAERVLPPSPPDPALDAIVDGLALEVRS